LAFNEDGLLGIGQGPSGAEESQFNDLAGASNFATSSGESAISSANNFWQSILSGDPAQISKVLGPAMSGINKQGQQEKMTLSQFGNRSGGTNAQAQLIGDKTRSSVDSLISSLTGDAAGALGASGAGLLSAGISGHQAAFSDADTIQKQKSAQINDIFKSIASLAAAPFSGGFSLPGFGGSGGGAPSWAGTSDGGSGLGASGNLDIPGL
jgi:hypothetical protein